MRTTLPGAIPIQYSHHQKSDPLFIRIRHLINTFKSVHRWMSGEVYTDKLPQRVQVVIREQQSQSEILIGWVQIGIVLIFGFLYTVSPKSISASMSFNLVPWVVGSYAVFTLIRQYLAYQRKLPFALLVVSVIVDMGLLLGLIWSFHLQYDQPASFYLKAPTLLYIFIFISLRALRPDPGFVVLSGVVAAGGWLAMAYYALWEGGKDAGGMGVNVTRDFAVYMQSNSVLLGAEFDKVISILMVTAILTIAIARARIRLIAAIAGESTTRDLSRFVPEEVVKQISFSDKQVDAGQIETREATILFIDIESFTTVGETLAPVQLVETLNGFFSLVEKSIRKYHGEICQFQGDAVLASFNLPQAHESHALNAVLSAIEIQQQLTLHRFTNGLQLKTRIGINTGTVVGGLIGSPDRLGYTVHGDAVNLASRLEQLNKTHNTRILLSESTHQHLMNSAEMSELDKNLEFIAVGRNQIRGRKQSENLFSVRLGDVMQP